MGGDVKKLSVRYQGKNIYRAGVVYRKYIDGVLSYFLVKGKSYVEKGRCFRGKWGPPKGHIDKDDIVGDSLTVLRKVATREVVEELGLSPFFEPVLDGINPLIIRTGYNGADEWIALFVIDYMGEVFTFDEDEVVDMGWFNTTNLRNMTSICKNFLK